MSRILRNLSFFVFFLAGILASCLLPLWAKDKPADDYSLSGKVLSVSPKGMHWYQVSTDSRVYLLLCERVKGFHLGLPECKVDDRPIAAGDTIRFRVDGDWAYAPDAKGAEQQMRILTAELKTIPPLPPPTAGESGPGSNSGERGMVIGNGMHVAGQKQVAWSINPSSDNVTTPHVALPGPGITMAGSSAPAISTGPVMAIPATGGAPVLVTPTAPMAGGVVTGIPVTGGAPVVGVPVGGASAANHGAVGGRGGPAWVHILHVQAGKTSYSLECSVKPCEIDKKQIELGDTLMIRTEKHWAYVSFGAGKEQKLRIVGEQEGNADPDSK